jgi:hypothetical protein
VMHAYPVPDKRAPWRVQVEFLDGTQINGMSDEDVVSRWRRMAAWFDEGAEKHPARWQQRVVAHARAVYGAELPLIGPSTPAEALLDALAAERCLMLRRHL